MGTPINDMIAATPPFGCRDSKPCQRRPITTQRMMHNGQYSPHTIPSTLCGASLLSPCIPIYGRYFFLSSFAWFPLMTSQFSTILSFPPIPNLASNPLCIIIPTILRSVNGLLYVIILVLLLVPVSAALTGSFQVLSQ